MKTGGPHSPADYCATCQTFLTKQTLYFLCKGDPENLYKGKGGIAEQGASPGDKTSPLACRWALFP